MVSLAGENSCSGKVGIEYGDKTYWLSGSNSTWNWNSANAVCRQLHCGEAIDFSSIPSTESMNDVWKKSYHCTPDATSLFNCSNRMADHCNSTAHVTCNGNDTCMCCVSALCCLLYTVYIYILLKLNTIGIGADRPCWAGLCVCTTFFFCPRAPGDDFLLVS